MSEPSGPVVLVFGTYDVVAHPRVAVVLEGLRRHGLTVIECNAPLGLDTATRVALLRQPWRLPLLALRLGRCWARLARLVHRARRGRTPDVVLVPYLGHFDIHLARLLFRRTPIVLDHFVGGADTAKDRGVSSPWRERVLRRIDTAALRKADLVMLDTQEQAALLPSWARERSVAVLIGAPDEWDAPPRPSYDGSRPLRVLFFGLFTPLQGATTIAQALGLLAGDDRIEATMAGGGQDFDAARAAASANGRVTWPGMVPFDAMPVLARDFDVCLGIFGTGPKALRVVPNKVYQGIRAGCAIVTSDTGPQRRVLGDLAAFTPPGDAAALADALRELAADPARVAALQAASRSASKRFGPDGVVRPLVERLAHVERTPSRRTAPRSK